MKAGEHTAAPKHTPGPWGLQGPKVSEVADGQTYWTIHVPGTYDAVGFFYPRSSHSKEQQQANAELIASAPETAAERDRLREVNAELIATLKSVRELSEERINPDYAYNREEARDLIDAAITKASQV